MFTAIHLCEESVGDSLLSICLKNRAAAHLKDEDYESVVADCTRYEETATSNLTNLAAFIKLKLIEIDGLLFNLKLCYFRSLELSPNDPKALFRRCQAYEALDQVDKAYQDGREVRVALNLLPSLLIVMNDILH